MSHAHPPILERPYRAWGTSTPGVGPSGRGGQLWMEDSETLTAAQAAIARMPQGYGLLMITEGPNYDVVQVGKTLIRE
jgi:hypothetical protein